MIEYVRIPAKNLRKGDVIRAWEPRSVTYVGYDSRDNREMQLVWVDLESHRDGSACTTQFYKDDSVIIRKRSGARITREEA